MVSGTDVIFDDILLKIRKGEQFYRRIDFSDPGGLFYGFAAIWMNSLQGCRPTGGNWAMLELLPANWAGAPYISEHLVRYVTPTLHARVYTFLISRASPSFSSSTVICSSLWRIPRSTSQVFSASREIHVISSVPFSQQPLTLLRCSSASHCAASHCHLVNLAYRHDSRCKERPALGVSLGRSLFCVEV